MAFVNWRKILLKKVYDALPKEYQWRTGRDIQREADVHRLYMLTSFWEHLQKGSSDLESVADSVAAAAKDLSFEQQGEHAAAVLHRQVVSMTTAIHEALVTAGDPLAPDDPSTIAEALSAQRAQETSSLVASLGPTSTAQSRQLGSGSSLAYSDRSAASSGRMTMEELAAKVESKLGYRLRVAKSGIDHKQAGDGLWLDGYAPPGAIIALYPGVTYNKEQYRHIPGYPAIDKDNSYIIGRYDGQVVDAKPWDYGDHYGGMAWPPVGLGDEPHSLDIEGRNPFALAHFANHPPAGAHPNVLVAAIDYKPVKDEGPRMRRYYPNVSFAELHHDAGLPAGSIEGVDQHEGEPTVPGLCLVASAHIQDEEVLLNYRYSPHVKQPSWYVPVDPQEDQRRWE